MNCLFLDKLAKGEDVWGYSFQIAKSKNGKRKRHLRPTKMHIRDMCGTLILVPYSKSGKLLSSKSLDWRCIHTSATESEAIHGYNALISQRINELEEQKKELEELIII